MLAWALAWSSRASFSSSVCARAVSYTHLGVVDQVAAQVLLEETVEVELLGLVFTGGGVTGADQNDFRVGLVFEQQGRVVIFRNGPVAGDELIAEVVAADRRQAEVERAVLVQGQALLLSLIHI